VVLLGARSINHLADGSSNAPRQPRQPHRAPSVVIAPSSLPPKQVSRREERADLYFFRLVAALSGLLDLSGSSRGMGL
jgi:hypothetical protein